jgi:hypothetical protein
VAPVVPAAAGTSPQASAPAPGAPAPGPAAAASPSPGIGYAVPGLAPPGVGSGPKAGAKEPDTVADTVHASAAAGAARVAAGARRERRGRIGAASRGYRDEFLAPTTTSDDAAGAEPSSSDQGAGHLGFTGTAPTPSRARPAGMVDASSAGATASVPLLPTTWEYGADEPPTANGRNF